METEKDDRLRVIVAEFSQWWESGAWWRGLDQANDPICRSIAQYAYVAATFASLDASDEQIRKDEHLSKDKSLLNKF